MPSIDYSKTVIYKLQCKTNPSLYFVYHTTDLCKSKFYHKTNCIKHKECEPCITINANSGWDNWEIITIENYNCDLKTQAIERVEYWNNIMKTEITTVENKQFVVLCEYCNRTFADMNDVEQHLIDCHVKQKIDSITEKYEAKLDTLYSEIYNLKIKLAKPVKIVRLGLESLVDVFSEEEQYAVLTKGFNSLKFLIKYTHFNNKYPQFNNINVTNVSKLVSKIYDLREKKFIIVDKYDMVESVVSARMQDISSFYENIKPKKLLSESECGAIERFIESMEERPLSGKIFRDVIIAIYNYTKN